MSGLDDWLPKDETEPFFGTPETRISAEELLKTWEKSAQESMDYERKYENELYFCRWFHAKCPNPGE